jgi:hypothetical protein
MEWLEETPPYYLGGSADGWDTTAVADGLYTLAIAPQDLDCQTTEINFMVNNGSFTTGAIKGLITDGTWPIAGAKISLSTHSELIHEGVGDPPPPATPIAVEVVADDQGQYQFDGVPYGLYKLELHKDGLDSDDDQIFYVHLQANIDGYMEVNLVGNPGPTAVTYIQSDSSSGTEASYLIVITFVLVVLTALSLDVRAAGRRRRM